MNKTIISTTVSIVVVLVCSLYLFKVSAPKEKIQYFDFSGTPMIISVGSFR